MKQFFIPPPSICYIFSKIMVEKPILSTKISKEGFWIGNDPPLPHLNHFQKNRRNLCVKSSLNLTSHVLSFPPEVAPVSPAMHFSDLVQSHMLSRHPNRQDVVSRYSVEISQISIFGGLPQPEHFYLNQTIFTFVFCG